MSDYKFQAFSFLSWSFVFRLYLYACCQAFVSFLCRQLCQSCITSGFCIIITKGFSSPRLSRNWAIFSSSACIISLPINPFGVYSSEEYEIWIQFCVSPKVHASFPKTFEMPLYHIIYQISTCTWVSLPVFYSVHWYVRPEICEDHFDPPLGVGGCISAMSLHSLGSSRVNPTPGEKAHDWVLNLSVEQLPSIRLDFNWHHSRVCNPNHNNSLIKGNSIYRRSLGYTEHI